MTVANRKTHSMPQALTATVESMSHDGRGITHVDGKTVFLEGALTGEEVSFVLRKKRRRWDVAEDVHILHAAAGRITPRCAVASSCGGCSLQHMGAEDQIRLKQDALLEALKRIGKVMPDEVLAPLRGDIWGYRRKARLGVRFVEKKGGVLVGFREKGGRFLTDTQQCEVLSPEVGQHLAELRQLISGMDAARDIAQIEVAAGDDATALVFRHLVPLGHADLGRLLAFAKSSGLHIYLQAGGPATATPLWPENSRLSYRLPAFDVELEFMPTDFIQVNADINRQMVSRAVDYLELSRQDRVLDLFCGLGNFSLPIARRCGHVVAVEGDAELVRRAHANAVKNGIDNASFHMADLSRPLSDTPWFSRLAAEGIDKMLLDPPRTGAYEIIQQLRAFQFKRIVYISCHPASLARDADCLVNQQGYRLVKAGIMDMFPHTTHVEAMAVFESKK